MSENFEDFLQKCSDFGILVDYNPDHKNQISHVPTVKIIRTTSEKFQQSQGLANWADRENMKAVSRAINRL